MHIFTMGCAASSQTEKRVPIRMPNEGTTPGQLVTVELTNSSPDLWKFAVFRVPAEAPPGSTLIMQFGFSSLDKRRGSLVMPGQGGGATANVELTNGHRDQIQLPFGLGPGMRFHYLMPAEILPPGHERALASREELAQRAYRAELAERRRSARDASGWTAGETSLFMVGALILI